MSGLITNQSLLQRINIKMVFGIDFISGVMVGLEFISGHEIQDMDGEPASWGFVLNLFVLQITVICP